MAAVAAVLSACGPETPPVPREEPTDAGTDVGTDAGTDAGADTDTDADAGTDAGHEPEPDGGTSTLAIQYGGGHSDEFLDVLVDDRAIYVAGYRNSAAPWEPGGDSAGIVRAYAHDGEELWESRYDVEYASEVADALAFDGETLLVAGRTTGSLPGFAHAGKTDLFVSRLHREGGTVTPLLQTGDERPQHPNRIVVDGRGDIVVSGLNDVYVPANYVETWEDTLLGRFSWDPSANAFALQSLTRADSTHPDAYYGLAAYGSQGDVIVSGTVSSGADRGPFVRRLTAAGQTLWTRRLTPVAYDSVNAVTVDDHGRVYAAGSTFGQLGNAAYGQMDVFVAVLDGETGEVLRTMQAGSDMSDWVRDAEVDEAGNVWVAGGTSGALPGFTYEGVQDAFLLRFDAHGAWTGSWQRGTPHHDEVNALALGADGSAYLVGNTLGGFIPGEAQGGALDAFLLRVSERDLLPPPAR